MAASSDPSEVADGPVLSVITKRVRALRKKHNRIVQLEESIAQGKTLIKEQEEMIPLKAAIVAQIDELEKLRQPISVALQEEHSLLLSSQQQQHPPPPPPPPPQPKTEAASSSVFEDDSGLEDLLKLLYFGILFDVKPQSEFTSTMLTRTLERECCLTYDYVTDDATDLLGERDFDLISKLGSLVIARPAHSGISHKNALSSCVDHARRWLSKSNQPIHPGDSVTYAGLRERLNKILASDYFTATPEMKAPVDVAAAAGKYAPSQVPVQDLTVPPPAVEEEGAYAGRYRDKDEEMENFQGQETVVDHTYIEDHPKDDGETALNEVTDDISTQQDQSNKLQADGEDGGHDIEQQYMPRRAYQNQRGAGRGSSGGGRRGYPNGRGGRGRGGNNYQNGRNQYYDSGNYYPRNYHNTRGRGSGGRFGGATNVYNNHGMAGHGHVGAGVEPAQS